MADVHTKQQRSHNMSMIKSKNTKPELKIKKLMKKLGFTYQPKGIYGKPDFVTKKQKIAVFVDGCFWHKCPKCFVEPKSNRKYWAPKLEQNVKRAKEVNKALKKEGWKVMRFWEHEIMKGPKKCAEKVSDSMPKVG